MTDPTYYTIAENSSVIVSSATASPGSGWTQRTLQDAITLAQNGNGDLRLLPGSYQTSGLAITAPLKVHATPGSVLITPYGTTCFNLDIRSSSSTTYLKGVEISGVNFWGNNLGFATGVNQAQRQLDPFLIALGTFNALVTAYRVQSLVIRDCQIGGSGSAAFAMWQCQNASICANEILLNSIALYSNNGWCNVFNANYVHDNANMALYVTQWPQAQDNSIISNNRIINSNATFGTASGQVAGSGPYGNAIFGLYAYDLTVTANICQNSTFSGIRLNGCFRFNVSNNQIFGTQETGIMIEAPGTDNTGSNAYRYEGGVVTGNLVENTGRGIAVTNVYYGGRRVTVNANEVYNSTNNLLVTTDPNFPSYHTTGVGIQAEGDVVVSGNVIEASAGPGILLFPSRIAVSGTPTTGNATGNTIKNAQFGIGFNYYDALGFTFISGNLLHGCTSGAIVFVQANQPESLGTYYAVDGTDYATLNGGMYQGKPYNNGNVMIGLNFSG